MPKFNAAGIVTVVTLCCALVLGACTHNSTSSTAVKKSSVPTATVQAPSENPELSPKPLTFTIVGTGDVLSHEAVMEASLQSDGTYDYAPLLDDIKPYIQEADLALCHQEVLFAKDNASRSGYPVFRAPPGWASSPKKLGYDGCSLASNHTWDTGRQGIVDTIAVFSQQGLGTAGANISPDQDPIQYYELHRDHRVIRIAHLSITYGTNYGDVSELNENPWLIQQKDPNLIVEQARLAREKGGADVVIASVHHGNEYNPVPSDEQRRWAKILADSGVVDLYLGHHVHVPQAIERIDGGVDGQGMYAFFGTGNLLSHHQTRVGVATETGIIARATLTVPAQGNARVDNVSWIAIGVDRQTSRVYTTYHYDQSEHPESELSNDLAQRYHDYVSEVVGNVAAEWTQPPGKPAEPASIIAR
ncbi:MAG: CapA family protein [Actinomycetaceae bacterium]|nr:CapA family protein [Actinomycetaceae bacterium]